MGKLPFKISQLCNKFGKKCYIISGSIEDVMLGDKMISVVDENTTLDESLQSPEKTLTDKAKLLLQ